MSPSDDFRDAARARPRWVEAPAPAAAEALRRSGVSSLLAPLLARRGVGDGDAARRFLEPRPEGLHPPHELTGISEAIDVLDLARRGNRRVVIVGDYDVDGVSSTALLLAVLQAFGIESEAIVPHRIRDGYGLQLSHVDRAVELGAGVLVTVDCGTTAHDVLDVAVERGLAAVVVDHHLPSPEPLPAGVVLVNPKADGPDAPCADLSAAGLAFKLTTALADRWGRTFPVDALLRPAVLGTVADVVPLLGENRIIATLGLDALAETRSLGLLALYRQARISPPFAADDIGFRIGPRLNAAGRMGSAEAALELLMTRDGRRAATLAERLETMNSRRRSEEDRVLADVRERLGPGPPPPIVVDWSEDWHQGVVGLAASRISRELRRPAVLLTVRGDSATGSGRSVPGIDLHRFLSRWRNDLDRFGGHAQAVGMTAGLERLEVLRRTWSARAEADWDPDLFVPRLEYELHLAAEAIDLGLYRELHRLAPHGAGNRKPLLRVGPLRLEGASRTFGKGHLKATAGGGEGSRLQVLGWGWAERAGDLDGWFEAIGTLTRDSYTGGLELRLVDSRPVEA